MKIKRLKTKKLITSSNSNKIKLNNIYLMFNNFRQPQLRTQ